MGMELKGIEVQSHHVIEARAQLENAQCQAAIVEASIFDVNLTTLPWANQRPILIVGNPPWITSAELSALGSKNVPIKSNFKGATGYSARTGSANFDIAEFILLKLIKELGGQVGTIALLCKRGVARNTLEFASAASLTIERSALYEVDAGRWFDASVDACLFVCDMGSQAPEYSAEAYAALDDRVPSARMRVVAGHLIEDDDAYAVAAAIEGVSPVEWRQGIKHDVSTVAELKADDTGVFRNGLDESVEVEAEWLYPLLKSSDVFNGRPATRRRVVVTQRTLKEDTSLLAHTAPRLWKYLEAHRAAFAGRKSSIYAKRSDYAMFGIGPYTFAPFKVVVSGMYKSAVFRPVGPEHGMPVLLDDTCYFLPFDDALSAAVVCALLNSELVKAFLRAVTMRGAKRPVTKRVLQRINLHEVAQAADIEVMVSDARRGYQRMTGQAVEANLVVECLARLSSKWSGDAQGEEAAAS